jgi:aminoglycoside phosphotransferase family enzyme/predicted kinase
MGSLKDDLTGPGVELVETHTAWVFLGADAVVLKVKKPVDFGFLDFTTLERRKAACDAELRLNARLSPGVYRDVVPVTQTPDGRHRIGGAGRIVDYAVRMNRLPDDARADTRLAEGRLGGPEIDRLAAHLARFHERVGTQDSAARFGTPEAILGNVRENFAQGAEASRALVGARDAAEIEREQIEFVETHRDLLNERVQTGRIRDGHGDLRLEHVYFGSESEPTIIDCIEFNDRFRYADVSSDIAFLSMDLERAGRSDLAERFLAAYARESGDYRLYELVDFYEAYRAYVRGKVSSLLAGDEGVPFDARERARKDARSLFLLSLLEGRQAILRPAVVAVGGVIASGKSTVATEIGVIMGAPVVDADRTRKALAGVGPTVALPERPWSGAYAPEMTERVYAEVLRRARSVLASGRTVVLDASFRTRDLRARARELARLHDVPFYFVECRASVEACRERLTERARSENVSDGRTEIFDQFVAAFEPVTELPAAEHLVVDTTLPIENNSARLRRELPAWPEGFNG